MNSLIIAFFISFIGTIFIIRTQIFHKNISGDNHFDGPQKFHKESVPRVGGLAIGLAIFTTLIFQFQSNHNPDELLLLLSAMPVLSIGIAEDLTKQISIRLRLFFIALGALIATIILGVRIDEIGISGINYLLAIPAVSIIFTIFAITGLTNAYNIIDGFNGLSSMVGIITLVALGYMGLKFNDPLIIFLSFTMVSSILGFLVWNYPRGLIFLGDGGAYLIGFWVAILSILLVNRYRELSPWFAVMVNAYPILETIFSIYRRKFHQGKNPGHPDGIHFHSLIFRRILNPSRIENEMEWFSANSKTSPYLWVLSCLAVIPALLFWNSTPILMCSLTLFVTTYVWLYKRIVTFNTPQWLRLK